MNNPFLTVKELDEALKAIQRAKTEKGAINTLAFIIDHYSHARKYREIQEIAEKP